MRHSIMGYLKKCDVNFKLFIIGVFFIKRLFNENEIKAIGKVKTLFICAHPDDESLFLYSAIRKSKDSFVLCLTRKSDPIRSREFGNAMKAYGISGVMCEFSDREEKLWTWKLFLPKVLRMAKKHLQPEVVWTHNEKGEYGHYDHKMVHSCVKKVFSDCVIKTSDDITENEQEKNERRAFLSDIYRSQNLKSWFPQYY